MTSDEIDKLRREHYADEVNGLDESDLVACWNQSCEESNCMDDQIYDNGESFFEMAFSSMMDAIRAVCFGEYRYQDDWVKFNGLGNLESSNDPTDLMQVDDLISEVEGCPSAYSSWIEEFEEPEEEDEEDEDEDEDDNESED